MIEREKALIDELISFVPYGPMAAELWAEKVDLECTQIDDHDAENCEKCCRLRRGIVIVIRSALKQQVEKLQKTLDGAKVPGVVGHDGRAALDFLKMAMTLHELDFQLSWLKP